MAAQPVSVNLLDQPEFEGSSVTRLFNWAVTYGRYIMIGTEVIVLLAFISRFSLDRKLTDLREEIAQKQIILEANKNFEEEIKQLQTNILTVNNLIETQRKPLDIFNQVISILPPDIILLSYKQEDINIELKLLAGTTNSFSIFLNSIQRISSLSNIEITEIRKDALRGTEFRIIAKIQ